MGLIWGEQWSHSPFIRRSHSWGFLGFSCEVNARRSMHSPQDHFIITLIMMTLGASGLWLGTQTEAGCIVPLTESFFGRCPWPHGQQVPDLLTINCDDLLINAVRCICHTSIFPTITLTSSCRSSCCLRYAGFLPPYTAVDENNKYWKTTFDLRSFKINIRKANWWETS